MVQAFWRVEKSHFIVIETTVKRELEMPQFMPTSNDSKHSLQVVKAVLNPLITRKLAFLNYTGYL